MERYICIHGHFYQPPRENPWLEAIERQDSADPYHDWNERITAECYATNATSRILDNQDRIVQIVSNYTRMSFNFGPTLLAWMEKNDPEVYAAILDADLESQKLFSGHGSALAQAYNHMILPLANQRDKYTQILWGIRDFEHRFQRRPEGMWLPETAVDLETLEIMAELGIRFTILAPHQANRVRPIGVEDWRDVSGGHIDPTMPYSLRLSSGRTIALFFYDGNISRAVAFQKLLSSGESFAERLLGGFAGSRDRAQIVHIATDGESYGHHHRFGDMALAYALDYIVSRGRAHLTNYGEYLEKYAPTHEVEICEKSSWSCAHGVDRWWSNCGCSSGKHPEWNQRWRRPLREALDWLRDSLAPLFEEKARLVLKDPWGARDDYISVILNRSTENREDFFRQQGNYEPSQKEKVLVLKLLELQRHAMLMYTSCGWFFDEISGIETVQIIQYAARALQLALEISGEDLESRFLELLERAGSNVPEYEDGRRIYEQEIKPSMADLKKVGAHYAMCSLFKEYNELTSVYCYTAHREDYEISEAGKAVLAVGRARFTSEITGESAFLSFGALDLGDHNLNCGVRQYLGEDAYQAMLREISEAFVTADFPETIRCLDRHFGKSTYSLKSLFRDDEQNILDRILRSTLNDAEAVYRQLYENSTPLMRFLKESGVPPPKAFYVAAEFILINSLRRAFEVEELDMDLIESLIKEARLNGVSLHTPPLEFSFRRGIERVAGQLLQSPYELPLLRKLAAVVSMLTCLPFQVNLWKVQNIFHEILHATYPDLLKRARQGDKEAEEWVSHFVTLGEKLSVRVN